MIQEKDKDKTPFWPGWGWKKKSWWRDIRWICNSSLTWDSRKMYVKFSNTGFWARELQVHSSLYVSCGHAKLSRDPPAPHQEHKQPEVVRVLSHGGGWWMHRWDMEEVCKMDSLSFMWWDQTYTSSWSTYCLKMWWNATC